MVRQFMKRLCADIRAATAVEYGLLLALLVLGILGALTSVMNSAGNNYNKVSEAYEQV